MPFMIVPLLLLLACLFFLIQHFHWMHLGIAILNIHWFHFLASSGYFNIFNALDCRFLCLPLSIHYLRHATCSVVLESLAHARSCCQQLGRHSGLTDRIMTSQGLSGYHCVSAENHGDPWLQHTCLASNSNHFTGLISGQEVSRKDTSLTFLSWVTFRQSVWTFYFISLSCVCVVSGSVFVQTIVLLLLFEQ